ncbi:MAG: hypothetical protein QOD67_782, partial [Caballeronia sp.]|nr:hypothetical protein [Caballeronia sp.]
MAHAHLARYAEPVSLSYLEL